MKKLSIVVPCYNESGNIPLIIERFLDSLKGRADVEVILVDNGSKDNSATIFANRLANLKSHPFQVLPLPTNLGYGGGILAGLEQATGDVFAWTHADMQTDPHDVLKCFDIYNHCNKQNIFIKGKRKNRRPIEAFFTMAMQLITWIILQVYIDDINAQPKMFSRDFYTKYLLKKAPLDFSLDLYALYFAKKNLFEIIEVPVFFAKRMHGEAKGGGNWRVRIKLIKRTLAYILELKKNIS